MMLPVQPVPYYSAIPGTVMPDMIAPPAPPTKEGVSGLGFDWSWVQDSVGSASKILLPAVATRLQTQPGVTITTTPQGQVISQQASGYPIVAGNLGANVASSGGLGTLLVAAAAVAAILLIRR